MRLEPLSSIVVPVALIFAGCVAQERVPVPVLIAFAGSASKPVIEEIAAAFEQEAGISMELTFGGSGSALSQIEMSGKGDLYIPGSPDYIVIAKRKGLLAPGSERISAYLVPAIIVPRNNPAQIAKLEDLARPGVRVGIGNPETVCLGLYSVELLEHSDLLDRVLRNVVTFGASCSKTANLTAMGHVDAILGWGVFESWNPARMQRLAIPGEQIPRIAYIPMAVTAHSKNPDLAQRFIDYSLSQKGRAVFERHGYLTDLEEAKKLAPNAGVGGEYTLPADFIERFERARNEP